MNGATFEIKELKKKIGELERTCTLILTKLNGSAGGENQTIQSDMLQLLPLKTTEEVEKIEKLLDDPANMKILVRILYLYFI